MEESTTCLKGTAAGRELRWNDVLIFVHFHNYLAFSLYFKSFHSKNPFHPAPRTLLFDGWFTATEFMLRSKKCEGAWIISIR
ncbi:MAG: hypothetical protein WBB67_06135, partial [bacterium]